MNYKCRSQTNGHDWDQKRTSMDEARVTVAKLTASNVTRKYYGFAAHYKGEMVGWYARP